MVKVCGKCNIEKEFTEFCKNKTGKHGLKNQCKSCDKEYYQANKESIEERNKKYYEDNKERIKEDRKKYYQSNKKRFNEYYEDNKERIKEYNKEYRKANKEYKKEYDKKYYQSNKERIKEYQEANKERIREYFKEYDKEYHKQRKKTDPLFKLKCNLRTRTYNAFKRKGYSKNTKTQEMLGAKWEIVKQHIESRFIKGMNWNNHGKWQIDHIIPLSVANSEKELLKLCHYTDLQPLWAEDNLSKGSKIIACRINL